MIEHNVTSTPTEQTNTSLYTNSNTRAYNKAKLTSYSPICITLSLCLRTRNYTLNQPSTKRLHCYPHTLSILQKADSVLQYLATCFVSLRQTLNSVKSRLCIIIPLQLALCCYPKTLNIVNTIPLQLAFVSLRQTLNNCKKPTLYYNTLTTCFVSLTPNTQV
jgi:hypothetical protein